VHAKEGAVCCGYHARCSALQFPALVVPWAYAWYVQHAWDVRNSCKHNGAVLPLSATPVGRGADGVDAMA
jgi:hypothetical protein